MSNFQTLSCANLHVFSRRSLRSITYWYVNRACSSVSSTHHSSLNICIGPLTLRTYNSSNGETPNDSCGISLTANNNAGRRERGGSVVECRTPEREVRGSRPTAAVMCPWARHFTPRKYWLITQEAMAPSRHDWKIVDWDVKPQHNQPTNNAGRYLSRSFGCSAHIVSNIYFNIAWNFSTGPLRYGRY